MAEIVFAAALSHSPLMFVPGVDGGPGGQRYRDAVTELRRLLQEAEPDVIVLFFPDHFRAVHYRNVPPFCIGVKRLATCGDWFLPRQNLQVDTDLAASILRHSLDDGFDLAFSSDLRIDHGGAQPIHVLGLAELPIVPILVNCAASPLPTIQRCHDLGRSVARALERHGGARRVAVLGSGGLSHQVPLPSWPELEPEDEQRYQTFVTGLSDEQLETIEPKRVEMVLAFVNSPAAVINEALDRRILAGLEVGSLQSVLSFREAELTAAGGSGMHEIRNWVAAFGAAGAAKGETLGYSPVPNWVTGMGVMRFTT